MFLTNTPLFTSQDINWWTRVCGLLVDYCDVFISCLDSHSDGTHSLQRIHYLASDVMLHLSKSTSSISWMAWGWGHFLQLSIFGWAMEVKSLTTCHSLPYSVPVHQKFYCMFTPINSINEDTIGLYIWTVKITCIFSGWKYIIIHESEGQSKKKKIPKKLNKVK